MSEHIMPLTMAKSGEMLKVVGLRGGWGIHKRVTDMGLTRGVHIRIINCQMPGPVVIELRGSRVALGRGIAQRIMVTSENSCGDCKMCDSTILGSLFKGGKK
ncbi:MAG: FeoA family protein [Petrotogales bacterium]